MKKKRVVKSAGETLIRNWLRKNRIGYRREYSFPLCCNPVTNQPLRFDFYLPKTHTCIEFDGKQHYEASEFDKTDQCLINRQYRDNLKDLFCAANNIKLIRISYKQYRAVGYILTNYLLKKK